MKKNRTKALEWTPASEGLCSNIKDGWMSKGGALTSREKNKWI